MSEKLANCKGPLNEQRAQGYNKIDRKEISSAHLIGQVVFIDLLDI